MFSAEAVFWIDRAPEIEIDGDGAMVLDRSGNSTIVRRMSRATLRAYAETAIRLLNEADRVSRKTVVSFDKPGAGAQEH